MYKIMDSILNKKEEKLISIATVVTVYPLTIKFPPDTTAIPAVSTNQLTGLQAGSRILTIRYGKQYIAMEVIGHEGLMKCVLSKTTTQSISTATETAITFGSGTEEYDPMNMHSTTTNTDRIYIPKTGLYSVTVGAGFAINTVGIRVYYISLNGSAVASYRCSVDSSGNFRGSLTRVLNLDENDYLQFRVYQSSGGNLNIGGDNVYTCHFSVIHV